MKILIVCQYYYPEQFQINDIAPALVELGHDVTVLTGIPSYPYGKIYDGYDNGKKRYETVNGVRIIRVNEVPRKKGIINLLLNYYSFVLSGVRQAKKLKEVYDLIVCYQLSPVMMAIPAITYKKRNNVPLLLYCLDIWPESAKDHIITDKGLIYFFVSVLSKGIYRKCDHISVTSKPFIEYLNRVNGIPKENMSYIPQHFDSSNIKLDLKADENDCADFMYAGNLGKGQRVDVIIKAAAELKSDNFLVHIVGDGSRRDELERLAYELGINDKIIFYGNQKREDMPGFYKKADVLLITLRGNNFVGNTMPGKLQAYMTCGKPIFGAINGAAQEVINEAKCGECVSAGDHIGLACIMKKYIEDPARYSKCGENAINYYKANFTFDIFMDRFINQINNMVKNK